MTVARYEPLEETAAEARRLAAEHCRDCAWYHGLWQYLRIFGVAAAPERHEAFLLDALSALALRPHASRVLISGSADYGMLAHVVRAYRANQALLEATVVDRCETPALLCQQYAKLVGIDLATAVADILDLEGDACFDVICTHSFLSQLPPARRPDLLARWRALLRPGGTVVTTTRINGPDAADRLAFTSTQAGAFAARVRDEAERRHDALGEDPEEMAAAALVYAERLVLHPTRSVEDVVALFEQGGFVVERLEVREIPGTLPDGGSGPGTSQAAPYAEIAARRG